jgi:hypothetical protein
VIVMDRTVLRLVAAIEEFESVRAELAALPDRSARRGMPAEMTELEMTLLESREAEADQAIISALCDIAADEAAGDLDASLLAFIPRAG